MKCPICGEDKKTLYSHIFKKHNLNKTEFIRLYPDKDIDDAEYSKRMSEAHKKQWEREGFREHMSEVHLKRFEDPDERQKLSNAQLERYKDPKEREKVSLGQKRLWENEDHRKKMHDARVRGATKQWLDKEGREKRINSLSKAQSDLWKDDTYRKSQIQSFKKKWKDEDYRNKMFNSFTNVKSFIRSDGSEVFMRSSYEVRCSEYLDSLGVRWEFEKDKYEIPYESGIKGYIPDFYLTDYQVYLEVKSDFYYKKSNGDVDYRIDKMRDVHHQIVFLVKEEELESLDSFRTFLINHGCADT